MGTHDNIKYMDTLPLVKALWWSIENLEPVDHTEEFFYLRERYRNEDAREEVLVDGRHKGWELAKSLQTQVKILEGAIRKIATADEESWTTTSSLMGIAQAALRKLEEHKES